MATGVRRYEVVIVGGGITGLLCAHKLSSIGLRTALIEREPQLATGPSTRNEGWLHRGTYHAVSIKDRTIAVQVARRCIYGHEQIRHFAPEAIETIDSSAFALVREADRVDEVVSRWDEAGVAFKPIGALQARQFLDGIDLDRAAAIFEVADVSINTRLVYRKLLAAAQRAGVDLFVGASITHIDADDVAMRLTVESDKHLTLVSEKIVYAVGFGASELFERFFGIKVPIRFWKSHLIVTPRISPHGVFFVDPHEAAMMQHGGYSIVGLNEDALLCPTADYNVVPDRADNLYRALSRLAPNWHANRYINVACTKVDLTLDNRAARSLAIAIHEPLPGHICVLPGKMTEAPYLADVITRQIYERSHEPLISQRPCDVFSSRLEGIVEHAV
ncbi:MAG TPA: FAD-dependent oxidoreductase [Xanthobacteraceae bacterium]|nr:FAD-dependent oxidoreductase [Xanthobacteraceae bacterium]